MVTTISNVDRSHQFLISESWVAELGHEVGPDRQHENKLELNEENRAGECHEDFISQEVDLVMVSCGVPEKLLLRDARNIHR